MSAQIAYEREYQLESDGRDGTAPKAPATSRAAGWGAVSVLTLCVATLIASEFMPVSLLTLIATGLHMTEGRAGQAIAVSGIFAVLTSLGISTATRGIDRRLVLLSLAALMLVSGLMVALAPNAGVFMTGRALIGVVIGGFWSMSAATVMRLVPEGDVPRAMGCSTAGTRSRPRSPRPWAASSVSTSGGGARSSPWCRSHC
jgi:predicted MFS family arabinose efflux permease